MSEGPFAGQKISSVPVGFDSEGRPLRTRRRRRKDRPGDVVLYPIVDGPGVALLVVWPPLLTIMTLPVLDLFVSFTPKNVLNPINLLMLPFAMPLIGAFAMLFGYILMFAGRILAASAYGEDDHPRWPNWDTREIGEGLGRWVWAGLMGFVVGGLPAYTYWINCGEVDAMDQLIFGDLAALGGAYALMAVAAALLNENLLAANPAAVTLGIKRVGWDYVTPCLVAAWGVGSSLLVWRYVLFQAPNVMVGVFGMWGCWVWSLYQLMIIFRALGLTYYRHAEALDWFRKPPRCGV